MNNLRERLLALTGMLSLVGAREFSASSLDATIDATRLIPLQLFEQACAKLVYDKATVWGPVHEITEAATEIDITRYRRELQRHRNAYERFELEILPKLNASGRLDGLTPKEIHELEQGIKARLSGPPPVPPLRLRPDSSDDTPSDGGISRGCTAEDILRQFLPSRKPADDPQTGKRDVQPNGAGS